MPPDSDARGLYPHVGSQTSPVLYRSETGFTHAAAAVGADSIRPQPQILASTRLNSIRPARIGAERVSCVTMTRCVFHSTPPQPRVCSAAFNHGMIAPGNHNFERFAALCNTPKVEPRALRADKKCACPFFRGRRTSIITLFTLRTE